VEIVADITTPNVMTCNLTWTPRTWLRQV